MFKAGDKVVCIRGSHDRSLTVGNEYVVLRACYGILVLENDNRMNGQQSWNASRFELPKTNYHPHHDLIIQWAKGAKIEGCKGRLNVDTAQEMWVELPLPLWHKSVQYRVKPEPSEKTNKYRIFGCK